MNIRKWGLLGMCAASLGLAACGNEGGSPVVGLGGSNTGGSDTGGSSSGGSGTGGGDPNGTGGFTAAEYEAVTLTMLDTTRSVYAGDNVFLHALAYGGLGDLSYAWKQTSGPSVTILEADSLNPSFVAPNPATNSELVFELVATDTVGNTKSATVTVNVLVDSMMANAGLDQTVVVGQTIQLHGSVAGGEGSASFSWKQTAGTAVTLSQPKTLNPAFTTAAANAGETLTFELTGKKGGVTSTDTVDIVVDSGTLSVDAGPDVTSGEDQLVYLHAVADSPLTDITYQWKPVLPNTIVLSGKKTPNPSFISPVVDTETVLTWEVEVADAAGNGPITDTVSVTVTPNLPTVALTSVAAAAEGDAVQLEAQVSGGVGPFTYAWTQVADSAPTGTLSDATIAKPILTAPAVSTKETLSFEVTVTDAVGHTVMGSTQVVVYDNVPAAPLAVNLGPNEGAVDFLTVKEGQLGSLAVSVTGGTPPYAITWSQPGVASEPDLGLTVPVNDPGRAIFAAPPVDANALANIQVSVTDSSPGQGDTATDTVTVTVQNYPMTVSAGQDRSVYVNSDVSLHASTSFITGAVAYTWSQVSGPSNVSLSASGSSNASFRPTVAGVYTFQVAAKDTINTSSDQVVITVVSPGITVGAGTDQTVTGGSLVRLTAKASGLPPFTFVWTQTAGPSVPLGDQNGNNPFFIAPQVATNTTLTFQVDLADGAGATASDTVDIVVEGAPPLTVNAGDDFKVTSGLSGSLHSAAAGGATGSYTFSWAAPDGILLSDSTSSNPTFTAPQVTQNKDVTFTLTVTDSAGTSVNDSVVVTIAARPMDCTTCTMLDCLLSPKRGICTGKDDVCFTRVIDDKPGRLIDRGCMPRSTAAKPPAACDDIEAHVLENGTTCVYACDGAITPNCNHPPQLLPDLKSRLPAP